MLWDLIISLKILQKSFILKIHILLLLYNNDVKVMTQLLSTISKILVLFLT